MFLTLPAYQKQAQMISASAALPAASASAALPAASASAALPAALASAVPSSLASAVPVASIFVNSPAFLKPAVTLRPFQKGGGRKEPYEEIPTHSNPTRIPPQHDAKVFRQIQSLSRQAYA